MKHVLVITGADGRKQRKVSTCANGFKKLVLVGDGLGDPACCGGCLLFKAVRCNHVRCGPTVPAEIFVCSEGLCFCSPFFPHCEPCARPYEDGMLVRYNGYCYRLETGTKYCPPLSVKRVLGLAGKAEVVAAPCVPLPDGAVVPENVLVDCCKECDPAHSCREIDGWFPAVRCGCPGDGNVNCVVYVSCSAYLGTPTSSRCPAWRVQCQSGGSICVTVRPDAEPVPDLPPGAIGIDGPPDYRDCCACCGDGGVGGCCFEMFTPKITKWVNGVVTETYGLPVACCRVRDQTTYSGSAVVEHWQRFPDGHRCLIDRLIAKAEQVGGGGGVWVVSWQFFQFNIGGTPTECPTQNPVVDSGQMPIPPCTDAAELLTMLLQGSVPGLDPGGNGSRVDRCDLATLDYNSFGNSTFSEHMFKGSAGVSSPDGCGNFNCLPSGGGLVFAIDGGCADCGKSVGF